MKSPTLEPLHNCRKKDRLHIYKERLTFPLLLWLLGLTILFFILYSTPKHFKFIPKQELHDHEENVAIKPTYDYESCDLFNGQWIPDLNGSLYTNKSCPTMSNSKNCGKHGRKDVDYLNWRWKPYGCDLQRFDAKNFLHIVQGKTLAFIGDSVARNHMESLLCVLSQEQTPVDMYSDTQDRFRTWYFPSHKFTIKVLWTKFFVVGEEKVVNGLKTGKYDLHLDRIENKWAQYLPGVDYAIISSGHWFFRPIYLYEDGNVIGCVYCDDKNISHVQPTFALRTAFRMALTYINDCKECGRLLTIIRTFSPAHFENGEWNTGGRCNRTSIYSEKQINLGGSEWDLKVAQIEEIERVKTDGQNKGKRFEALDVTKAMMMRPDGHPDIHWNNQYMEGYSDCVHWCLPGPIDVWNDLLMAVFRKEDYSSLI
ncbi:hypothetical protein AQUCO_02500246v1 [Aquilegia coerulea]|uniref:Uncharacterized protein n=1 Tax=Aquilegia coerulea TaxID=218851 RepID=A0A2G5DAB4_AQUCA|nr:hypothetical protein AQUCO_02500246v1 [Aquilegia coerulea]